MLKKPPRGNIIQSATPEGWSSQFLSNAKLESVIQTISQTLEILSAALSGCDNKLSFIDWSGVDWSSHVTWLGRKHP